MDANGNWSLSTNWQGGVIADGANSTANFTFDITASRTVTNDTPRTIGNINFDDLGATGDSQWTLAGTNANPLTLSTTSGTSIINTGGLINFTNSFVIGALLAGSNNVVYNAQTNSNGQRRQYAITNVANSYTGTTTVQNGFLNIGSGIGILAAGGPLGIPAAGNSTIILGNANTTANTSGSGTSANLGIDLNGSAGVPNPTVDRSIDSSKTADNLGRTVLTFNGPGGRPEL